MKPITQAMWPTLTDASCVVRLTVPWPPTGDKYWRVARGKMYVSPEGKAYRALLAQLFPRPRPLLGDVVMSGAIYRPTASGDLGNRLKVLEDALEGIAYINDKQIARYRDVFRTDEDPGNPRVELQFFGEAFATPAQVKAAAVKKLEANQKRRATLRRNRWAKFAKRRGSKIRLAVYR